VLFLADEDLLNAVSSSFFVFTGSLSRDEALFFAESKICFVPFMGQ